MQPLHSGTEKANSVARVVVKPTPRLCKWCASNTLIHSGGAGLRILGRILDLLLAKKDLSAPLMFQPAEYLRLKGIALHAVGGVSHHSSNASRTLQSRFSNMRFSLFQTCGKDYNILPCFILLTVWKITT